MKKHLFSILKKSVLILIVVFFNENVIAQDTQFPEDKNYFWNKVQFGGGLGLSIGGGYTDISVSPSAVYNINPYIGVGSCSGCVFGISSCGDTGLPISSSSPGTTVGGDDGADFRCNPEDEPAAKLTPDMLSADMETGTRFLTNGCLFWGL